MLATACPNSKVWKSLSLHPAKYGYFGFYLAISNGPVTPYFQSMAMLKSWIKEINRHEYVTYNFLFLNKLDICKNLWSKFNCLEQRKTLSTFKLNVHYPEIKTFRFLLPCTNYLESAFSTLLTISITILNNNKERKSVQEKCVQWLSSWS